MNTSRWHFLNTSVPLLLLPVGGTQWLLEIVAVDGVVVLIGQALHILRDALCW